MDSRKFINIAKALSILGIVIMHVLQSYTTMPGIIKTALSFGGAGVSVFLFCSGYGLTKSQDNKTLTFIQFMKRRFLKIYIPYILIVILFYIFRITALNESIRDNTFNLLSHIFLYKMFFPKYIQSISVPFWYISVAVQFYLIFLLLHKLLNKIGSKKFLLISGITTYIYVMLTIMFNVAGERVFNSSCIQFLFIFALGMVSAKKEPIKLFELKIWQYIIIFVVSVGIYGLTAIYLAKFRSLNDIFGFAAFITIAIVVYKFNIFTKFFEYISSISYELYLTHILTVEFIYFILCKFNITNVNISAIISFVTIPIIAIGYNYINKKYLSIILKV